MDGDKAQIMRPEHAGGEQKSLRTSAFMAITFSTVAVASCLITFPLLFHYVLQLEANAQIELEWCYTKSKETYRDVMDVRSGANGGVGKYSDAAMLLGGFQREKRQAGGCCTCERGLPGPSGRPGVDGRDGSDGQPGNIGPPGDPVPMRPEYLRQFPEQCPCESPAGPDGQPGRPGNPGLPGDNGAPGGNGNAGPRGPPGPKGPPGNNGNPGNPGQAGGPGQLVGEVAGNPGQPGNPGNQGGPGAPGQPGGPGKNGDNGTPGDKGNPGLPGQPGQPGGNGNPGAQGDPGRQGGCDHCPPARLAPGY